MGTINLLETKNRILKAINEFSTNGEIISSTDENNLDYTLRMNSLIDMHQRKIATSYKKISKVYKFTQYPPTNLITNPLSQFDILRVKYGTPATFEVEGTPKAYCIKVDGNCIINIETQNPDGTWSEIALYTNDITVETYGQFETYKVIINYEFGDLNKRLSITATNSDINIRSIALYSDKFPSNSDIPVYEDLRAYTMPDNYYNLQYIVLNGQMSDSKKYVKTSDFEHEGRTTIYLPFNEIGEYRIHYWAYPTKITDITEDITILDIDDECIDALVYGVAMDTVDKEQKELYNRLKIKYEQFISTLNNENAIGGTTISNTLFAGNSSNKLF